MTNESTQLNSRGVATAAFIINEKNEMLVMKRSADDTFCPDVWECPGGRLDGDESPIEGLHREVMEEAGIEIKPGPPLGVHHFRRDDDNQLINLIVFLCEPISTEVTISNEHSDYKWLGTKEARKIVHPSFLQEIDVFEKYFKS